MLTAHAAGEEWDVVQPVLSLGGLQGVDRWCRLDGASPQGSVGGFITPRAVPVLYFSQFGKTAIKHAGDVGIALVRTVQTPRLSFVQTI